MAKLSEDFGSIPPEYQDVLRLAQETHNIKVTPLQQLKGGGTGACLYQVGITSSNSDEVEHFVLSDPGTLRRSLAPMGGFGGSLR